MDHMWAHNTKVEMDRGRVLAQFFVFKNMLLSLKNAYRKKVIQDNLSLMHIFSLFSLNPMMHFFKQGTF